MFDCCGGTLVARFDWYAYFAVTDDDWFGVSCCLWCEFLLDLLVIGVIVCLCFCLY